MDRRRPGFHETDEAISILFDSIRQWLPDKNAGRAGIDREAISGNSVRMLLVLPEKFQHVPVTHKKF